MPVAELTANQGTAVTAPEGCSPDSAGEERPKVQGFLRLGTVKGSFRNRPVSSIFGDPSLLTQPYLLLHRIYSDFLHCTYSSKCLEEMCTSIDNLTEKD